jgi:hypothetical protein
MTPGNNGASTPEDDDPFGYLYADGQASGATPPRSGGYGYPGPAAPAQPGVPRTSYNQVRAVGERQYGQPQVPQQPAAHYATPETLPGYQGGQSAPGQGHGYGRAGGGRGQGPNTKGLLIGAIAVVAAVVIGIGVALASSDSPEDTNSQAGSGTGGSQGQSADPTPSSGTGKDEKRGKLPKSDASKLTLAGGATVESTIQGAKSSDGSYVTFPAVGASAEWTVNVPKGGKYTVVVYYSVPGKGAKTTLTVNGQSRSGGVDMENHANAEEGAWDKGWTYTYNYLDLNKGTNALKISCEQDDQCEAIVERVSLVKGHVKKS